MRMSTLNKIFLSVLLLILSTAVYAADSGSAASLSSTAVTNHTDVSIAYLASVFGSVGNVLQGTSGQMLGMMFLRLNEGILVVAGLWLVYTAFSIIMRSAHDGSMMNSPTKYVGITFVRIALGVAMLVPNPSTGYSLLQEGIMKAVVEGVSLADSTWSMGLGYVANGGTLWHRPEDASGGFTTSITSEQAKDIMTSMTSKVFQSEVCMFKAENTNNSRQHVAVSSIFNNNFGSVTYRPVVNDKAMLISFPGSGDDAATGSSCGQINWGSVSGVKKGDASEAFAKAAVTDLVNNLMPKAREYASGNNTSDQAANISDALFSATLNYMNGIMPIAQQQVAWTSKMAKTFIPDAISSGWITAGRYYWDLSRIQAHYMAVSNIDAYSAPATAPSNPPVSSASMSNYINLAVKKVSDYSKAAGKGDTGGDYTNASIGVGNWIMDLLLGPIIGDIIHLILTFSTSGVPGGMGPDPIFFLHRIGMYCLNLAGDIYIEAGIGLFIASLATMVCQSTFNADTPITAVADWIKPPLMMLATMMLGVGVMLGYYIPLYPFMLFTFGIISWLIAVIEAMVAAPLVALGLTHPEGHDFLGKAEQALMIVLGVFLRPVLMVIGLIAGMILSYVSLRILVYTYSGFVSDIFYSVAPIPGSTGSVLVGSGIAVGNVAAVSGSISGLVMSLFAFPLFLCVFAGIVYMLVTQCFSLIYVLPDYILRWIGGPQTPNAMSPQQMAQQIGQHMSQGAQKTGQVIESAEKNRQLAKANQTEHKKGGDDEGGGAAGAGGGGSSIVGGGGGA